MSADDPKLVVALEARLDKFEKQLADAGLIADRAASSIEDRFSKLNPGAASGFVTGLVSTLTAGGVIGVIAAVTSALAELGDRATDLHLPVDQLQALSLAAKEAGIDNNELSRALTTFTAVSKQTDSESNKFYNSLRNIGSGFVEAFKSADTQAERLNVLGRALRSTSDEVKRAQLTLTAFGSDSERVTEFFSNGSERISEYTRKAREWGIAIDDAMVKKAQEAKTTIELLASVLGNKFMAALGDLLPVFKEALPYFEKIGAAARDAIAGFASPSNRPTATIKNEIADLEDYMRDFTQKRDALLRKRDTAPDGNVMANFFGTTKETIDKDTAEIDSKMEKYGDVLVKRRALLQSRLDASDKASETPVSAFKPRPDLGAKSEDSKDAFDRQAERLEKQIALYQAETDTIGLNAEAKARARAEAELTEALLRSGIEINDEYAAKIDEISAAFGRAAAATDAAKRQFEGANDATRYLGGQLASALSNIDASTKGIDLLRTAVRSLANELIKAAITGEGAFAKLLGFASNSGGVGGLFGPIAKALGGVMGLGGGELPGFGTSEFVGPLLGRASGGPVLAGQAYMVGENGPELFTPDMSGRIIPNNLVPDAVSSRQEPDLSVNMPINIDARGADAVALGRVAAEVQDLKRSLPQTIVAVIRNKQMRGTRP